MNSIQNSYDLSFILIGLKANSALILFQQVAISCQNYTFEFILVSPRLPPLELERFTNFKYIRDFGCPSRCLQLASTIAVGKYMTWASEDGFLSDDHIVSDTIDLLKTKREIDIINCLYSEGINYTGSQHLDPSYWKAYTHPALRHPGVDSSWDISLSPLLSLELFRKFGGVDCRFEANNMNSHDLMFKMQKAGSKIFPSPRRMYVMNHNPNAYEGDHNAVQKAWETNDMPLFTKLWSQPNSDIVTVPYDNWRSADNVWHRRIKDYAA